MLLVSLLLFALTVATITAGTTFFILRMRATHQNHFPPLTPKHPSQPSKTSPEPQLRSLQQFHQSHLLYQRYRLLTVLHERNLQISTFEPLPNNSTSDHSW